MRQHHTAFPLGERSRGSAIRTHVDEDKKKEGALRSAQSFLPFRSKACKPRACPVSTLTFQGGQATPTLSGVYKPRSSATLSSTRHQPSAQYWRTRSAISWYFVPLGKSDAPRPTFSCAFFSSGEKVELEYIAILQAALGRRTPCSHKDADEHFMESLTRDKAPYCPPISLAREGRIHGRLD